MRYAWHCVCQCFSPCSPATFTAATVNDVLSMLLLLLCPQHSAVVGEVDEDIDAQLDLSSIKAEPLLPVLH